MRIVNLEIQNVKRIRAVQIRPTGNVVRLTGANAAGKSSILDAIASVFVGAANLPKKPIRKGQTEAFVSLDLGDIIVRRDFSAGDSPEDASTRLTVESADGARYPSPQKFIDALYAELTFDPGEFLRMKPADRLEALRAVAPIDVDVAELKRLNFGDYTKRTEWGRLLKSMTEREKVAREHVDESDVTPLDVAAITKEHDEAVERNARIEKARASREARRAAIAELTTSIADVDEQLDRLKSRRSGLVERLEGLEKTAAGETPLPDRVPTAELSVRIKEADDENRRRVAQAGHRAELLRSSSERQNAQEKVDGFTAAMDQRMQIVKDAIARAKMPIEGLTYDDGSVQYDGVPFEQASAAEQLRISMAIAMAKNPKVRVILVRDASLFDEDSMQLIYELAAQKDFQVWIEVAEKAGRVGILIEDGAVAAIDGTPVETATHAAD